MQNEMTASTWTGVLPRVAMPAARISRMPRAPLSVFAMTQSHLRILLPYCSEEGPQPRLLAPGGEDVVDPIGSDQQVYRDCAQSILRYLQATMPELRPL